MDVTEPKLEEKRAAVIENLQKRRDEREAELLKKKTERELTASVDETVACFKETFDTECQAVETELGHCDHLSKTELIDKFDSISKHLQRIQKYVSESSLFLPSYDLRVAQEASGKLQQRIQEKRDELLPKKKFGFKNKKPSEDKKGKEKLAGEDSAEKLADKPAGFSIFDLAANKFVNETKKTLVKGPEDVNQKDVALANLTDCTVKLYGSPSAIHMNNVKNCKIFSGPVSSSIFIQEATDCVFVMPCQQLRIHRTTGCHFYIHVTCKAIIEDCSKVFFAPFNWHYDGLDEHFSLSGLDRKKNNWADVDDFNWLAADEHSPNWAVLPEEQRVKSWDN